MRSSTPSVNFWIMTDKCCVSTATGTTLTGVCVCVSLCLPPGQVTGLLCSMFGDPREMELHYFLADDTIEILEKIPPNSGRDAVPMFLRRSRLPKDPVPLRQPGVGTKRTVLNVFGPMGHGGRYILDSLKVSAQGTSTSCCCSSSIYRQDIHPHEAVP